ncbi:MAG: NAD-dependent epimerase/dehydratase family protein [Anaerolineae bacterium]|nr:NAD-dependent epimerase/dehydratase family protein [Anaerolineae bacterium]MDH7475150.1 NAD-dependent epimerase/dehydratase family protein [Anaerolineae bacterium]
MTVLVTGGTGFIGSHVVRALIEQDKRVRVLLRKTSSATTLEHLGVELFYGDLTDKSSLDGVADNVSHVVHLAGLLGGAKVAEQRYWEVNVQGTANLLEQFQDRPFERFVYCSTTGVLGPISNPPADETWPLSPSNLYELTKCEAETLVRKYSQDRGIPAAIIRPGLVYGPGNLHLLGLFRTIQRGLFFLIGTGSSLLDPVYIDDMVQGLLLSLYSPQAMGRTYIIAGERPVTIAELVHAIGRALGKKPYKFRLPVGIAMGLARCFEWLGHGLGFDPPLSVSRVRFLTENRACRIDRAREELGYHPTVDLEEGLRRTVIWYREQGLL